MSGSDLKEDRTCSLCPQCEQMRGEATCLVMGKGRRTLHYRCRSCQHEWQHAVAVPAGQSIFQRLLADE